MHDPATPRAPVWTGWLVALVGWLAGDLVVRVVDVPGRRDRAQAARAGPRSRCVEPDALLPAALSGWTARELRSLPGIGAKRAIAIVAARWSRDRSGGPLALDDVPGIGPRTVQRIEAELAERAASDGIDPPWKVPGRGAW